MRFTADLRAKEGTAGKKRACASRAATRAQRLPLVHFVQPARPEAVLLLCLELLERFAARRFSQLAALLERSGRGLEVLIGTSPIGLHES